MKRTGEAKEKNKDMTEQEYVKLAIMEAMSIQPYNTVNQEKLQNSLNNLVGENKTDVIEEGENYIVLFKETNSYYKVNAENVVEKTEVMIDKYPGNITIGINGESLLGTEEQPYEIWCIEDLLEWSKNYETYQTSYIVLQKDLYFTSKLSYADSESTLYGDINEDGMEEPLKEEMQKGIGFNPIESFSGNFDGRNHGINDIYIHTSKERGAFIATNNGTISNFIINGNISTQDNGQRTGGITGYNYGIIKNCKSKGEYSGKRVGGIAAENDGSIEDSYNYAIINGSVRTGGIAGASYKSINKCFNYAKVNGQSYTGGIVGSTSGNVNRCGNYGDIYGHTYVGGIIGINWEPDCSILYNAGKINAVGNFSGGIIGYNKGNLENAYNIGNISSTWNAGGLIGYNVLGTEKKISKCYNIGCLERNNSNSYIAPIGHMEGGVKDRIYGMNNGILYDENNTAIDISKFKKEEGINEYLDIQNWKEDINNVNDGYPVLSW